jgi:hypothetical protein
LHVERRGGGAYLGESEDGEWLCADPESVVMVLGPPRSGKTSAVMIPALLGAPGAAISTSTKPDVMRATRRARSELGRVWLFDSTGQQGERPPAGVRQLRWSPVAAADSWDRALITARAMTASAHAGQGTSNEGHWRERAAALLAPLLCRQPDGPPDRGRAALDAAPGHDRRPGDRRQAAQARDGGERAGRDRAHRHEGAIEHLQRDRGGALRV